MQDLVSLTHLTTGQLNQLDKHWRGACGKDLFQTKVIFLATKFSWFSERLDEGSAVPTSLLRKGCRTGAGLGCEPADKHSQPGDSLGAPRTVGWQWWPRRGGQTQTRTNPAQLYLGHRAAGRGFCCRLEKGDRVPVHNCPPAVPKMPFYTALYGLS